MGKLAKKITYNVTTQVLFYTPPTNHEFAYLPIYFSISIIIRKRISILSFHLIKELIVGSVPTCSTLALDIGGLAHLFRRSLGAFPVERKSCYFRDFILVLKIMLLVWNLIKKGVLNLRFEPHTNPSLPCVLPQSHADNG